MPLTVAVVVLPLYGSSGKSHPGLNTSLVDKEQDGGQQDYGESARYPSDDGAANVPDAGISLSCSGVTTYAEEYGEL